MGDPLDRARLACDAISPPRASHTSLLPALSRLTLWAAGLFAVILGFGRLSYGLMLPMLQRSLGASYATLGSISTINFIGYLLGMLAVPLLLARWPDRVRLNLIATLCMSLAIIASATSADLVTLAAWRFVIGFCSAPATALTMALTLELIVTTQRGQGSGLIWVGGALGIAISGILAPILQQSAAADSWRWLWVVMGGIGLAVAAGYSSRLQKTPRATVAPSRMAAPQQHARPLFRPRQLLFLTLSYIAYGAGYIIYFTFIIAWFVDRGLPAAAAGLVWAGVGIGGTASGVIWGRLFDRHPSGKTLALALALGALGVAGVLTHNLVAAILGAALVGLCALIAPPSLTSALLQRAVLPEHYTASFSTLTALFATGQILGPLTASGLAARWGLDAGIALSAALLAVSALFALVYGIIGTFELEP